MRWRWRCADRVDGLVICQGRPGSVLLPRHPPPTARHAAAVTCQPAVPGVGRAAAARRAARRAAPLRACHHARAGLRTLLPPSLIGAQLACPAQVTTRLLAVFPVVYWHGADLWLQQCVPPTDSEPADGGARRSLREWLLPRSARGRFVSKEVRLLAGWSVAYTVLGARPLSAPSRVAP